MLHQNCTSREKKKKPTQQTWGLGTDCKWKTRLHVKLNLYCIRKSLAQLGLQLTCSTRSGMLDWLLLVQIVMVLTDSTTSVLKRGMLSNNWCKLIVICKNRSPRKLWAVCIHSALDSYCWKLLIWKYSYINTNKRTQRVKLWSKPFQPCQNLHYNHTKEKRLFYKKIYHMKLKN